jgi:hypothetical protein
MRKMKQAKKKQAKKKQEKKIVEPLTAAFFLLWNELSELPPRVKFETLEEASRVGEKLARKTGQPFHILKVLRKIERQPLPVKVTSYT